MKKKRDKYLMVKVTGDEKQQAQRLAVAKETDVSKMVRDMIRKSAVQYKL